MALVIVDMQVGFESARCLKTRKNIVKAIRNSIKQEEQIVILEYSSFGNTYSDILEALKDYPYDKQIKFNDDGSQEVLEVSKDELFKVCGVNLGFCVRETIEGLIAAKKGVSLIKDACNCSYYKEDAYAMYSTKHLMEDFAKNGVEVI